MPEYMLLVYEEEVDRDGQVERERDLPVLMQMHRSLREAGLLGTGGPCGRSRPPRRSASATGRPRSPMARSP